MREKHGTPFAKSFLAAVPLLLALGCGATGAGAEEPVPAAGPVDALRSEVRTATATLAGQLDAFLSDREYEAGLNETRVAVRFGIDATRDGEVRRFLEPRLRLSLPQTERRLFLDIFGFDRTLRDESGPASGPLPGEIGGSVDAIQLRLGTTFRGLDVAPAVGLRFDETVPSLYAGLRVGASRQAARGVALSGSQRLLLDSERRFQAITLLRADWQRNDRSVLRAQFVLDWRGDRDGLLREPSLVYRQFLDDRTAISFENTVSLYTAASDDEDSLETALRLRRQVGREGIFAEVRPWLKLDPEEADDRTYGVELSLDVTF